MAAAFDEDQVGQLLLGQGENIVFFRQAFGDIGRAAETDRDGAGFLGPVRVGPNLLAGDDMVGALDIGDLVAAPRQFSNGCRGGCRLAVAGVRGCQGDDRDLAATVGIAPFGGFISFGRIDVEV